MTTSAKLRPTPKAANDADVVEKLIDRKSVV